MQDDEEGDSLPQHTVASILLDLCSNTDPIPPVNQAPQYETCDNQQVFLLFFYSSLFVFTFYLYMNNDPLYKMLLIQFEYFLRVFSIPSLCCSVN